MEAIKALLKRLLGVRTVAYLSGRGELSSSPEGVFTGHYDNNYWASDESISGPGSTEIETRRVRDELPRILAERCINSFLDAPCGDFHWLKTVDLSNVAYIGGDVVKSLIEVNQKTYGNATRRFEHLDITRDPLPTVDLVFCRDCLFHLSFKQVKAALANIRRSGSRYLLTTTHPATVYNVDIPTGEFRPLNLTRWPINLPKPIELIYERPDAGFGDVDKALGLWQIQNLPSG